jgi:hypothetical protein
MFICFEIQHYQPQQLTAFNGHYTLDQQVLSNNFFLVIKRHDIPEAITSYFSFFALGSKPYQRYRKV